MIGKAGLRTSLLKKKNNVVLQTQQEDKVKEEYNEFNFTQNQLMTHNLHTRARTSSLKTV